MRNDVELILEELTNLYQDKSLLFRQIFNLYLLQSESLKAQDIENLNYRSREIDSLTENVNALDFDIQERFDALSKITGANYQNLLKVAALDKEPALQRLQAAQKETFAAIEATAEKCNEFTDNLKTLSAEILEEADELARTSYLQAYLDSINQK